MSVLMSPALAGLIASAGAAVVSVTVQIPFACHQRWFRSKRTNCHRPSGTRRRWRRRGRDEDGAALREVGAGGLVTVVTL